MPKQRTGEKLKRGSDGTYVKRVRLCGAKQTIRITQCRTDAQAEKRATLIVTLATRMTHARTDPKLALVGLQKIAGAPADLSDKAAFQVVDELVGGWRPESASPTFASICDRWNTNSLHREYPDDVPLRKVDTTIAAAKATLRKHILPVVGGLPVDLITLDHCNAIKKAIASVPRSDSRRQILTPLKTVLDLCVHPLALIERSPLPAGWLPSVKGPRVLQWVKPAEDALLMACTAVPLWRRVLWGFYMRSGARENEALAMAITQFDLGAQPIAELFGHQCKTKKPRAWPLEPGDADALRAWVALARSDAKPGDRMFVDGDGQAIDDNGLPALLRADLQLAGVTRAELFTTTLASRNVVVHDLRASFVTVKLSVGWQPDQIEARTGHESLAQMKKYKRLAGTLKEAAAAARQMPTDFAPLADAIPELRAWLQAQRPTLAAVPNASPANGQALATTSRKRPKIAASSNSIVEPAAVLQGAEMTGNAPKTTEPEQSSPARSDAVGQSLASESHRLVQLEAQVALLMTLVERQPAAMMTQLADGLARTVAAAVVGELQRDGVVQRPRLQLASDAPEPIRKRK